MRVGVRRIALAGSGLVFGGIALLSLVAPQAVAKNYAYTIDSPDAFNEFHAVFTGFWLGLCAWMVTAARKPEERLLGDLAGLAIGLQATARLVSIVLHGMPQASFVSAMIGEAITCVAVLQARSLVPER